MRRAYEVIVIGGGHAGVEAAWAAANLLPVDGAGDRGRVALVTLDPSKIGVMSCNPAIGGLAKGQLVREVDALGGLMGLATDATGIQFKVLNTSKGAAVRGPRAQCDRHAYAEEVQRLIASRPEIEVIAGSVEELVVQRGRVEGVRVGQWGEAISDQPSAIRGRARSGDFLELSSRAVVLTTGTFMRGLMHTGDARTAGGRAGEGASVGISRTLEELGFELGRLKTGTPPRLKKSTIDWEGLEPQYGDAEPLAFSDLTDRDAFPVLEQVECRQTQTAPGARDLIRANLDRAPIFSGQIESAGPRYCPSIEDKVVRFGDRETHGVFLEPESLRDEWVYCNGISTSLPGDVQDELVRTMPGCERAEILRHGYAVEYDMVRPHQIHATGMTRLVEGLFLAGQINGTSGYEEAAAQGLVAGVNAVRFVRRESEFVLGRDEAYIGVLMDDLVTRTPTEPYRMFTSRAEHRLLLRADNSADRLTGKADELGLLDSTELGRERRRRFVRRRAEMEELRARIGAVRVEGQALERVMRWSGFDEAELSRYFNLNGYDASSVFSVTADVKYEPYVERARADIRRRAELEHRKIPGWVEYDAFGALRGEAREALAKYRPATFGQAGRLEGVTPADVMLLSVLIGKGNRE